MICDTPCNSHRIAELSKSEHCGLGLQVLSHYVELLSAVMNVGIAWTPLLLFTAVQNVV